MEDLLYTGLACLVYTDFEYHDIEVTMVCTGAFSSAMERQISEKIEISCFHGDILMNRKNELGGAVVEREKWKYRRWGAGAGR